MQLSKALMWKECAKFSPLNTTDNFNPNWNKYRNIK